MNKKNNARATQLQASLPVSPLAKENGNSKRNPLLGKSFEIASEDNENESDQAKDEDSDENNPAEPVSFFYF